MLDKDTCKKCFKMNGIYHSAKPLPNGQLEDIMVIEDWEKDDDIMWNRGLVRCRVTCGYVTIRQPRESCPFKLEHAVLAQDKEMPEYKYENTSRQKNFDESQRDL